MPAEIYRLMAEATAVSNVVLLGLYVVGTVLFMPTVTVACIIQPVTSYCQPDCHIVL